MNMTKATRRGALVAYVIAMAVPAVALAAAKSYVLRHPKREHCKAHYVKKVEDGKTVCVRLIPTGVYVGDGRSSGDLAEGESPTILVTGIAWWGGTETTGKPLANQTIRFTVTDDTTGKVVGSFTNRSNTSCVIAIAESGANETFTGEAGVVYPACTFAAPITAPATDELGIVGSFAGNSTYAPSVSKEEAFGA